ncbi:MAG: formylglycine-generating enzyme family protein [Polyangiaceae bacterium]|jgi:hypothetical protein|nr:formylglycine-generating enzyme family protein [Polyangiaceae bacterium]
MKKTATGFTMILSIAVLASGCGRSSGDSRAEVVPPGPGDIPESVLIPAQEVALGFVGSPSSSTKKLGSFRISRSPVTAAQYLACMRSGACGEPAGVEQCTGQRPTSPLNGPTLEVTADGQLPVTCVSSEQAQGFCRWVGATLPSLPQWLLAARGAAPQRYAWGDDPPTCEHHPWAYGAFVTPTSCCSGRANCDLASLVRTGSHARGSAWSGIEDVLLTPGELVAGATKDADRECTGAGCVVHGHHGAIEGVTALGQAADSHVARLAASFRCVWEDGQ